MKTIGILGGLGPESTAEYYRYITRKYYDVHADYAYPEIVIYSLTFQPFIDAGYELPDKVEAAIKKMHLAGADFVVASCNSLHLIYEQVAPRVPIPWISIMDATAEAIKKEGLTKVGLLGTVFTMSRGFYQKALAGHGIETVTPYAEAQAKVNDILYNEVVRAIIKDDSRQVVLGCIEELRHKGAQGIVLGCTELPFLIKQEHTDLRVFDTTTIHAQKALDLALE
jgi:aspartate racemase